MLLNLLNKELYRNSLLAWAGAAMAFLAVFAVLRGFQKVTVRRLRTVAPQTPTLVDDVILRIAMRTWGVFQVAMGLAVAATLLDMSEHIEGRVRTAVVIIAILQGGAWLSDIVYFLVTAVMARREQPDPASLTARNMLRFVGMTLVWAAVVLLCLDNLGVNVSTLIAGLGVTGVAVALATQNIVGDLFASISILLDKPFLVGDFIIADDFLGTVERIGVKTTRLRSLGGEVLIMANSDLSKSRLRNYKNMRERRVVFAFTVRYETPLETVRLIDGLVKDSIASLDNTRFDRCHLAALAQSGLQFEVVFYVLSGDYNIYASLQHRIHLGIMERFARHNIQFAYPTHVVFGAGEAANPFKAARAS